MVVVSVAEAEEFVVGIVVVDSFKVEGLLVVGDFVVTIEVV